MIFQNAWAWTGLLLLAVPVLIHLLGRRRSRVQPFPTLRFLDQSRLLPVRRTRLTDLPLLAVRIAILAVAVTALAQPLLLTGPRRSAVAGTRARAIIVDTGISMRRLTPAGTPAREAARAEARRSADEAGTHVLLETARPATALAGAAAWLDTQPGTGEIVMISDFQAGTLDSVDIALVPSDMGLAFTRIALDSTTSILESTARTGDFETLARIALVANRTDVEWSVRASPAPAADNALLVLAGASERAQADAARRAASTVGAPPVPMDHPVAIVLPHYEGRAALLRASQPLDQPWMGEAVVRMRADAVLAAAAAAFAVDDVASGAGASAGDDAVSASGASGGDDVVTSASGDNAASALDSLSESFERSPFVVVARTGPGEAVVAAARASVAGRDHLVLFLHADAGSLVSVATMAAAAYAVTPALAVAELEPAAIADTQLDGWRRAATPGAARAGPDGVSDGRWLWLLVLALLALETWMRRDGRQRAAGSAADIVA